MNMTKRYAHLSHKHRKKAVSLLNGLTAPSKKSPVTKVSHLKKSRSRRSRKLLKKWSGRADLNRRPPAPKAGALTRLRYVPNLILATYYLKRWQFPIISARPVASFLSH